MKRQTFLGALTFIPVLASRGEADGSRPRHIHFKVRAKGFPELTSQIYFKGDDRIQKDFARNTESARVITINKNGEQLSGQFDIYL